MKNNLVQFRRKGLSSTLFYKSTAIFLSVIMIFTMMPLIPFTESGGTVNAETTYDRAVSSFINDGRWKDGATYYNQVDRNGYINGNTFPYIANYRSTGCCAYAADFCKYVFGKDNPRSGQQFSNRNDIRAGDVIHWEYRNASGQIYDQHWYVVLYRNGNQLTTAEGAFNGNRVRISNSAYTVSGTKFSYGYHNNGAPIEVDSKPLGFLDSVTSYPGKIVVKGWSFDRDCPGTQNLVHVYLDGPAGTGTCIAIGKANTSRPDVNKVYPGVGNYHGYEITIDTRKFSNGRHKIYVHGISFNKSGKDAMIGANNCLLSQSGMAVVFQPEVIYTVNTGSVTGITNTKAKLGGSLSPAGTAASWGFYLGTSESDLNSHKYTVAASSTASGNMTAQIDKFAKLSPGRKYYYKVWANVNNQNKTGSVQTFTTTAVKPEIPTLKVASSSKEIGIGDAPEFSWNSTDQTDYYKMYLYDESGEEVAHSDNITGTKYAFGAIDTAGTYTAKIESHNAVGTKGKSEAVSFIVHPDVTVTFKDADSFVDVGDDYTPTVIHTAKVHWGHDVTFPVDPSHTGYTFSKWSGESKNLKEDTTITAVYEINKYSVKYVDSITGNVLGTEKVPYYSAAKLVDFPIPTGYAKAGYDGWDKDYHHITEDTILYTCVGWYSDTLSVHATITNAVREYNAEDVSDDGYTVTLSLKNWPNSTTKGRAVVALKTKEGKLLTTTESAAFSIKKDTTKEIEVFVPYENAATIAEAYVVGQYKDAVPCSNNASYTIDQTNTMTSWSTEDPGNDVLNKESRTEYRFSDKQTTTSYDTSLAGYTQDGGSWVKSGSGEVNYVSSFPSGMSRSNKYYSLLNKTPPTAYENNTSKRSVSTSTIGYLYWHWCRNNKSTPGNYLISDCYTSEFNTCHAFMSMPGAQPYDGNAKAHRCTNSVECTTTYWWIGAQICTGNNVPIYKCSYTDYKKLFNYYRWTDWSDWSPNSVTANSNKKVETRTVYRYQPTGVMEEDNSGKERTVKGSLGEQFAGKQATLFIYKVNEASDFTNEYVAQTELDANGGYSFNFKLREEPSTTTGDYTVVLGVEGMSTAMYLDTIEAPKQQYTVNYYDYDGNLIKSEKVNEGENAPLPDESKLHREGYTFAKWSETNLNVTEDRNLYAEYKINTYNVVFVDWKANTVSVEQFDYGAPLVAPQAEEPEAGKTVEWDKIADGVQTVTEDMVVTTRYETKKLTVTVLDAKGDLVKRETVDYGTSVDLPEMKSTEKRVFQGWEDISGNDARGMENTLVTTNAILCPVYSYTETVKNPTADLKSGVYNKAQTVTLSCETNDADIYYTLDGSEPTGLNAIRYTKPIVIDDAVELKFYACKAEMNDSQVQSVLYSVNYNGATSKWMTINELPDEVKNHMSEYTVQSDTGYRYKEVKKVTTIAEAASLEDTGWEKIKEDKPSYTAYTDWSDQLPSDTDSAIGIDVDSKPVYEAAYQYTYSHYVYEDGVTKYAPSKVEGFECELEETLPFDKPLNVAGFNGSGEPYYVYDGKTWYNQKRINGQIQTGTMYRWRYEQAEYAKWSDWTTDDPTAGDTRDYESATVYRYERHNSYIVTVHFGDDSWSYLANAGSHVNIDGFKNNYEYYYENMKVYRDSEFSNEWDLESDTVSSSVDLYIKADKRIFDVTFYDQDGEVLDIQNVPYGESAEPPKAPNVEGFVFLGWDSEDYKSVSYESMAIRAIYVPEDEYATVQLDNESLTLYKGKSADLTAIVSPNSKADADLTWTSSDTSVAMVSDTGTVTGLGAGTADIAVKVNETGETAVCKVTVKVDNATSLVLIKNDKLKVDSYGYLRGIKGNKDTASDIVKYFDNANVVIVNNDEQLVEADQNIGTGYKVRLLSGDSVLDEIEVVVTGDIIGDGAINNRDVSMLLRCLLDKIQPTDAQILAADANGDGTVNIRDAVLIARSLVGKAEL